jgi:uncharacterized protein (TIGR00645 family)
MSEKNQPDTSKLRPLPRWIFMSRWLQAPLYIGLIAAQAVYVWQFWTEILHLIQMMSDKGTTETEIMLIVLGLIDVVMISNLLVMVIVGGWETFVSRLELEHHPDQPEWLSHVNAGVLKVKLATAIIGISSIHLLKTFINAPSIDEKTLMWQTYPYWFCGVSISDCLHRKNYRLDRQTLRDRITENPSPLKWKWVFYIDAFNRLLRLNTS